MKKDKVYKEYMYLIRDHPLFHGFSERDILHLLAYFSAEIEIRNAGMFINTIETPADEPLQSCCILSGHAQHLKYDVGGKCSILLDVPSGSLLGCTHLFADVHYHTTNIMAVESCICLYLNLKKLKLVLDDQDHLQNAFMLVLFRVSMNIVRILSDKHYQTLQKVDILARRTIRDKIMTYLLYMRDKQQSDVFDIPLSRQEWADYLCVERSSLSTELGKLQQEGLLQFHRNHFHIKSYAIHHQ